MYLELEFENLFKFWDYCKGYVLFILKNMYLDLESENLFEIFLHRCVCSELISKYNT